jgi:hypothetical protein
MVKIDNVPVGCCGMADITGLIGDDMGIVLARRLHSIMTGCTGSGGNFTMIEANNTPILCRGMTGITFCVGLHMIGIFTELSHTIVTIGTTPKGLFTMDKVHH